MQISSAVVPCRNRDILIIHAPTEHIYSKKFQGIYVLSLVLIYYLHFWRYLESAYKKGDVQKVGWIIKGGSVISHTSNITQSRKTI